MPTSKAYTTKDDYGRNGFLSEGPNCSCSLGGWVIEPVRRTSGRVYDYVVKNYFANPTIIAGLFRRCHQIRRNASPKHGLIKPVEVRGWHKRIKHESAQVQMDFGGWQFLREYPTTSTTISAATLNLSSLNYILSSHDTKIHPPSHFQTFNYSQQENFAVSKH